MNKQEILKKVDHTILAQTTKWEDIKKICDDGIEFTISGLGAETLAAKTAQTNGIQIVGRYIDVTTGQSSPAVKTATISVKSSASQSV